MTHPIARTINAPHKLAQAILQVITVLDRCRVELARIMLLQCVDMWRWINAQPCLASDASARQPVQLFVRFYPAPYGMKAVGGVAMCHCLRMEQDGVEQLEWQIIT